MPHPAANVDLDTRAHLLPLWPHELTDQSSTGRRTRIDALKRALRAERQRGIAGHWTYDLARHWALLRWYRAETDALVEARQASAAGRKRASSGGVIVGATRKRTGRLMWRAKAVRRASIPRST